MGDTILTVLLQVGQILQLQPDPVKGNAPAPSMPSDRNPPVMRTDEWKGQVWPEIRAIENGDWWFNGI